MSERHFADPSEDGNGKSHVRFKTAGFQLARNQRQAGQLGSATDPAARRSSSSRRRREALTNGAEGFSTIAALF